MDTISEDRLQEVNPVLADKIRQLSDTLSEQGFVLRVTQGLRTWADQDLLYAQGRTAPGQVVTDAKGGESWHNFGCAVDLVPMNLGIPDWDTTHPVWQKMISVGESLGLYSGSQFEHLKDMPHFQWTGRFPVSPDDEARALYQNGVDAFWAEVNAT